MEHQTHRSVGATSRPGHGSTGIQSLGTVLKAVFIGMLIVLIGTIPRNILFAANLRYYARIPWAIPLTAVYLWLFWRYLNGAGAPASTAAKRRMSLRAKPISGRVWLWALLAGVLAIIALVLALRVLNRLVILPQQHLPDMAQVPASTILSLLLMAAPVAGIVEEAAFRGYMQGPIEQRYGLPIAILITGTLFAVAHLDFTLVLWPYYVIVSAIYGTVTYLTKSILPSVMLHTSGNLYSNMDLWLSGHAEWQAASESNPLIWETGPDTSFWMLSGTLLSFVAAAIWAYIRLATVVQK